MDATKIIWIMIAAGACFLAYLLYTRQFKWVFGVLRSGLLGCVGIVAANFLLAPVGLTVGINALTAFIVGVLGLPGFMLLYAAQMMVR